MYYVNRFGGDMWMGCCVYTGVLYSNNFNGVEPHYGLFKEVAFLEPSRLGLVLLYGLPCALANKVSRM